MVDAILDICYTAQYYSVTNKEATRGVARIWASAIVFCTNMSCDIIKQSDQGTLIEQSGRDSIQRSHVVGYRVYFISDRKHNCWRAVTSFFWSLCPRKLLWLILP